MNVNVLFRFSKKTGKIDKTMTGLGTALMKMYALNNTPKSKNTMIIERDTGKVLFLAEGKENDWPTIKEDNLGNATEYGIPLEALQAITDDRFDN